MMMSMPVLESGGEQQDCFSGCLTCKVAVKFTRKEEADAVLNLSTGHKSDQFCNALLATVIFFVYLRSPAEL